MLEDFDSIIKSELNVKELECVKDDSLFNDEYLSVNFKKAGAVLKGNVQALKNELASVSDWSKIMSDYKTGKVSVGHFENLDSELFNLEKKPRQDFVIAHENGNTVVLDINLDPELYMEGLYREFVRGLQVMRKEADFAIDERIKASFETSDEQLKAMLEKFGDKIMQEALICQMCPLLSAAKIKKSVEVGDGEIIVSLESK